MTECSCDLCKRACCNKPGWFLPEEIKPLADFLGMTEKEVFDKHLLVDYVTVIDHDVSEDYEEDVIFVLSPAIVGSSPGGVFPANPHGVCQWFQEGKCTIHTVKPYECREYNHDTPRLDSAERHANEIPNRWVPHQKYIEGLLEYLPDVGMSDRIGAVMDISGRKGLLAPPTAFKETPKRATIHIDLVEKSYEEVIDIAHCILGSKILIMSVEDMNLGMSLVSREITVSNPTVTLAGWVLIPPVSSSSVNLTCPSHEPINLEIVTTPDVGMRMGKMIRDEGGVISKPDVPTPTPERIIQTLKRLKNISEIVCKRYITDNLM